MKIGDWDRNNPILLPVNAATLARERRAAARKAFAILRLQGFKCVLASGDDGGEPEDPLGE